jgi:lipopolysaccharide export system permease protein
VWSSLLGPDQVNAVPIEPEGLSMAGLLTYLRFLRENGLSAERYELALWNKLVYPLATGVMVFVSVVLVLGPLRWFGLGRRIMIGIAIGIVFHIVQKTTMHAGLVYQTGPVFAVLGPPLAFLGLGILVLRRLN